MRFFRNLAGVLLTSAVSAPVGLVASILAARLLSTDDRGLYAIALTFATMTTMIFQFGWPGASIYRVRSVGTPPAQVAGAAVVFLGTVSVLVVVGAVVLEPLLRERLLSDLPLLVFYVVLATVPFRILANGFGSIARAVDRFRYENWYSFLLQVGNLVALVVALVLLGSELLGVMVALSAVYIVTTLGLIVVVLKQTGFSLSLPPGEIRESLSFGLKIFVMTTTGRLHERIDIFMLAYFLADPTQIAFYAIAKGGTQLLRMLPNALGKVAYPHLAGLGTSDAATLACGVVRQGLLFMVPTCIALFIAAPVLLPLVYGEPYAASTLPFLLMLPGVVLLGTARVISRYFVGTNQHKPNAITRAVSLVVNVGLNLVLIPRYGIIGAASASLVSYAVDAILILAVFLYMTDSRLRDLVLIRSSDLDPYRRQLRLLAKRLRPGTP
jgi:O-antigen/teichoic acid export membrane protein